MAIGHGRRITTRAIRAQAPSSDGVAERRRTINESTRRPSNDSVAGSTTTAPTIATATTAMPA